MMAHLNTQVKNLTTAEIILVASKESPDSLSACRELPCLTLATLRDRSSSNRVTHKPATI
jgi:hypothetical protein